MAGHVPRTELRFWERSGGAPCRRCIMVMAEHDGADNEGALLWSPSVIVSEIDIGLQTTF